MKILKFITLFSVVLSGFISDASYGQTSQSDSVQFEKLTWTEIDNKIHSGTTTIIIPVGATEQSGPYLAVGKHNTRVKLLADEIAQKLGHTLVAPVVSYVPEGSTTPRSSHMRFPGTITVPNDVFEKMMISAAESFRVQGFKLVVFLGDHGGYNSVLEKTVKTLNKSWHDKNARAFFDVGYYTAVTHDYAHWLAQHGYAKEVGMHADISDTSLLMAADPSMVRQQALRQSGQPLTSQGIYGGDPRRASAALGKVGLEMQVNAAVHDIRSLQQE